MALDRGLEKTGQCTQAPDGDRRRRMARPPKIIQMNSDAATLDALDTPRALRLARDTLGIEADALQAMSQRLDGVFGEVVQRILRLSGRVVVMGMGKSGHVGRKVAATLASTGTTWQSGHGPASTWCWRCPTAARPMSSLRCCRPSS